MITFNGLKFAKTEDEFINSLFESDGTCFGYYRKVICIIHYSILY